MIFIVMTVSFLHCCRVEAVDQCIEDELPKTYATEGTPTTGFSRASSLSSLTRLVSFLSQCTHIHPPTLYSSHCTTNRSLPMLNEVCVDICVGWFVNRCAYIVRQDLAAFIGWTIGKKTSQANGVKHTKVQGPGKSLSWMHSNVKSYFGGGHIPDTVWVDQRERVNGHGTHYKHPSRGQSCWSSTSHWLKAIRDRWVLAILFDQGCVA